MFAFKVLTNTTPTQHPSLVICSSCDRSNRASHWRYFARCGFVGVVVSRAVWCAFRLLLRTQDNVYRQRKRFNVSDKERERERQIQGPSHRCAPPHSTVANHQRCPQQRHTFNYRLRLKPRNLTIGHYSHLKFYLKFVFIKYHSKQPHNTKSIRLKYLSCSARF